jgi:hypothetical protein
LTGPAVLRGRREASRGGDRSFGADVSGAALRRAIQSFRLRLHSGLRQSGAHSSRKMPRDEWAPGDGGPVFDLVQEIRKRVTIQVLAPLKQLGDGFAHARPALRIYKHSVRYTLDTFSFTLKLKFVCALPVASKRGFTQFSSKQPLALSVD